MFGRHREPSPGIDAADRILLAVTQIEELTQEVRELVAEMKADEPDNA